ncbi:ribose 5-phosphate isomerase A [Nematocida sp. AWRm78]|nr:ribose 5-phosphate isomerase A [Nematocida sp. AWRm79]KAI5182448.1 ribose 5-phosphate isomerase A [Nematocida sp. AWRm78]
MRKEYTTYKEIVEFYVKKINIQSSVVGIGSGRTATLLLNECINANISGKETIFTATSTETEVALASHERIAASMQGLDKIDLYFDGADYVDSNGWIIKGYGGAIFLERIAMHISELSVIVVPPSKCVHEFTNLYVPVEIVKPSLSLIKKHFDLHSCTYNIRYAGKNIYTTYLGNIILDVMYSPTLSDLLNVPGIVAHGLIPPSSRTEIVIVKNPLY